MANKKDKEIIEEVVEEVKEEKQPQEPKKLFNNVKKEGGTKAD